MSKERIDVLVVQQGLATSRENAKRMIMAGQIYDDKHQRYDKAGEKISTETVLVRKGETLKYVSRGGLKLEKALEVFGISVAGQTVLDIGSSTGGFTDVSLQNGAKLVYALDVGTNQLDWKIRNDERVVVMEQVNFRYSKPEDFTEGLPSFACMDVSFISLRKIWPVLKTILISKGEAVALIKPQFEAGRERVGKKGIVSDPVVHRDVLHEMIAFSIGIGYDVLGLDFSPITGGTGNIEYLVHLQSTNEATGLVADTVSIEQTVQSAHEVLRMI